MPKFYIIAGCNGAGKTTASFEILPQILNCKEFVNADEIAKGLSPFQPETVAIEAGRLMINRIQDLLSRNVDFAIETTLSSRSYVNTIKQAKSLGYETYLLYFWLSSPQMAVERVAKRVSQGGHHIPTDTIFRRYKLGIKYLFGLYLNYADNVMILDNSYKSTLLIANNQLGKEINIIDQEKFETLKSIANEK